MEPQPGAFDRVPYYLEVLLEGATVTVSITLGALAIAVVLGLFLAILRTSRWTVARLFVRAWVERKGDARESARLYRRAAETLQDFHF